LEEEKGGREGKGGWKEGEEEGGKEIGRKLGRDGGREGGREGGKGKRSASEFVQLFLCSNSYAAERAKDRGLRREQKAEGRREREGEWSSDRGIGADRDSDNSGERRLRESEGNMHSDSARRLKGPRRLRTAVWRWALDEGRNSLSPSISPSLCLSVCLYLSNALSLSNYPSAYVCVEEGGGGREREGEREGASACLPQLQSPFVPISLRPLHECYKRPTPSHPARFLHRSDRPILRPETIRAGEPIDPEMRCG
jgi:hypothetical protein